MNIFIICAACAGVLLGDFLPHRTRAGAKERAIYLALLAIGFAALVLNAAGVKLPSIAVGFQDAFTSIFGEL